MTSKDMTPKDTTSDDATSSAPARRRPFRKTLIWALVLMFFAPALTAFGALAYRGGPTHWGQYDRSLASRLPPAASHPDARILVMSSRTRGWKGALAVHSWIVVKGENERAWRRYDVAGLGSPVRLNWWPPDLWFGTYGTVVADIRGAQANALIPRVDAAIKDYQYRNYGDYRIWPGPNSNTFVATVLRAIPEVGATMPPNAVGRDFRPWPYLGLTDSGTGVEANLWGLIGVKLGWVEGLEVNFLGLVAGLDIREPALKVPGHGRLGMHNTATAATSN
jgi:hypothetical protein